MKTVIISLLVFSICGCVTAFKKPAFTNPTINETKPLIFEEIDENSDGKIEKKELETFNKTKSKEGIEIQKPVYYFLILLVLVFLVCFYKKILIKANLLKKNNLS